MCMTLFPATLTNTIIYAAEAYRVDTYVHILGYQNKVRTNRPNAMILPFPSSVRMGPENVVDTTFDKSCLERYRKTIAAHTDSRIGSGFLSMTKSLQRRSVQVFNHGSYTTVLADSARDIPQALGQVQEDRRPQISPKWFEAFEKMYPNHQFSLECWSGEFDAEPLMWWYEPTNPKDLFLPGLDAHDGNTPDFRAWVERDHTLAIGSLIKESGWDVQGVSQAPFPMKPYLSEKVFGLSQRDQTVNGDWYYPVDRIPAQEPHYLKTVFPPPGHLS